jgi:hypothetical protein
MTPKLLTFPALLAAVTIQAQTPVPSPAIPPPVVNLALLIERNQTLAVIQYPAMQRVKGPWTFSLNGLGGADVTNQQGDIGASISAQYALKAGISITFGFGATLPLSSFTWAKVNKDNAGIILGVAWKLW